jgi:hypothetical protein
MTPYDKLETKEAIEKYLADIEQQIDKGLCGM